MFRLQIQFTRSGCKYKGSIKLEFVIRTFHQFFLLFPSPYNSFFLYFTLPFFFAYLCSSFSTIFFPSAIPLGNAPPPDIYNILQCKVFRSYPEQQNMFPLSPLIPPFPSSPPPSLLSSPSCNLYLPLHQTNTAESQEVEQQKNLNLEIFFVIFPYSNSSSQRAFTLYIYSL